MEKCRSGKGPLDGITLRPTGTWKQVEDDKWGQTGWGKVGTACARKSFGPLTPAWEESADERWRPTDGGDVQVEGSSETRQEGGEEEGATREIEAELTGKIWRGDRTRWREKKTTHNTVGTGGAGGL